MLLSELPALAFCWARCVISLSISIAQLVELGLPPITVSEICRVSGQTERPFEVEFQT